MTEHLTIQASVLQPVALTALWRVRDKAVFEPGLTIAVDEEGNAYSIGRDGGGTKVLEFFPFRAEREGKLRFSAEERALHREAVLRHLLRPGWQKQADVCHRARTEPGFERCGTETSAYKAAVEQVKFLVRAGEVERQKSGGSWMIRRVATQAQAAE